MSPGINGNTPHTHTILCAAWLALLSAAAAGVSVSGELLARQRLVFHSSTLVCNRGGPSVVRPFVVVWILLHFCLVCGNNNSSLTISGLRAATN